MAGINSLRGFSLLGAASRWFLQGPGWSLLPIPFQACLSFPPHLHPFFLSLCSMGSIQWEIAIKMFTNLWFSLWLPLRRVNVHNSLFLFLPPKMSTVTKFPGISFLMTEAPRRVLIHLDTTPQWIIKLGAKGRGEVLVFRHGGENAIRSNFFRAQHLRLVALQISSRGLQLFYLPFFPLIIHTSGTKRGVLFSF